MDALGKLIIHTRDEVAAKRKRATELEREAVTLRKEADELERVADLARSSTY
jgi:hypothetical protein